MYEFNKYKEPKEAKAKKITIRTYIGSEFHYCFIPFDGKGGTTLTCDSDFKIIQKEKMTYLKRFVDCKKIERRKSEKEERCRQKSKEIELRKSKGLLTFREASEFSKIGYSTLWFAAKDGRLPITIVDKVKYVTISDLAKFENKKSFKAKTEPPR